MRNLKEAIAELTHRLTEAESQGQEILALIPELDRELRVRCIAKVGAQVERKLEKAQNWRWDLKDVRLFVKCNGEIDLILPSKESSNIFEIGLEVDVFVRALQKTVTLIREGSEVDPFVLLEKTAAAERRLSWNEAKDVDCSQQRIQSKSVQSVQVNPVGPG